MKKVEKPKKPLIFYYLIALIILVLLNTFLFPNILGKNKVKEVDYGTFLTMVEGKEVSKVELNGDTIYFTDNSEEPKYYETTTFDDPNLVNRLEDAGCEFGRVAQQEMNPLLSFFLVWILPLLIFWALGQWLAKKMMAKMGGGAAGNPFMQFGKSNAKVYVESTTGITFQDVAGEDEAKELLTEIVDFLHNPQKYTEIGAVCPKGALLVGPPGTGKTLLAKAVAGEANVPFFSISGSEFVEMFVGMGASKVRDLFKQANEKAPCIVFIDEIDTIGKKRDNAGYGGNDEREQTLNQLLTEMDGFDASKGVVILAATNRPDSLDPALLRPGRFDRRIPVELPDLKGREEILKVHAKKVRLGDDIDFNAIARAASGASGAELANMVNEAALRAVRENRKYVTQADLEESIETVIAGYQKKNQVLSSKEKLIVSYHEIGHALVAALQTNSAPVTKITIIPRTSGALGYTMQVESEERNLMTQEELINKIATLTGGRCAEKLIFNSITTGASNDIEQATKIARAMITQYGMSEHFGLMGLESVQSRYLDGRAVRNCGEATAAEIDEEIMKMLKASYEEAKRLLSANRDALDKIAAFLIEKETITGKEFMKIFREVKGIPEPEEADGEKKEEQESGRILMKPTETQAAEPETVKEPETEKEPETQATEIQPQETVEEEKSE